MNPQAHFQDRISLRGIAMKKIILALSLLLMLLLYGCSVPQANIIETLKGWSFQFNEETNDFTLFFGLLDKNGDSISAEVDVDIRIVNENNEEVYRGTRTVSKSDFNYYTSQAVGEQYLANIRIPASDISSGTSSNGKVYLTVYKTDIVQFDEVNCEALYCLPVKGIQLTCDSLPLELKIKDYLGNTESTIQVNDVSYNFESK